jgi:hypothetical protein
MADRDSDSQEQDVSLKDVMKAVRAQGELHANISYDIYNLRQEVHGAVASQDRKLKKESQYKWKYEGNKVQFLLNWVVHGTGQTYCTMFEAHERVDC